MNKTLSILYLEDDWNDVELAGSTLSKSGLVFEIDHVRDRQRYIQALEKKEFDVILIDFKLPSFDGLSALRIAKQKCADTPLIILSGTVNEKEALEIINEGAADYVLKDSLPRLPFSIRRAVREKREIDELRHTRICSSSMSRLSVLSSMPLMQRARGQEVIPNGLCGMPSP